MFRSRKLQANLIIAHYKPAGEALKALSFDARISVLRSLRLK
jgi:hypothetical protein